MKILVISDLHCQEVWKERVLKKDFDKVIFLGDYLDSYVHTDEQMLNNFLDVIQYAKDNFNTTELLIGNHELSYFFNNNLCSGFRSQLQPTIRYIYNENKDLFNIAYQEKNYLFTHAGVSLKWFKWMKDIFKEIDDKFAPFDLAESLNFISKTKDDFFLYSIGSKRGGLRGFFGGPLWADRDETMEGIIPNFHQIVGHTPQKRITKVTKFMGKEYRDRSITYCDVLQNKEKEFLLLEI